MFSNGNQIYAATREGIRRREVNNAMQSRKLADHIRKLDKEIARLEKRGVDCERKHRVRAESCFQFFVKLDLAYRSNPNGLDDLLAFADSLKTA